MAKNMGAKRARSSLPTTLPFDEFWRYLQAHPNCILRAGTPDASLYDDDDLHWHLGSEIEGSGTVLVELIRGKHLVADVAFAVGDVSYVQLEAEEGEDWRFEVILESANDRVATHFFVMSHPYEGNADGPPDRLTH